jgi:hypothetical protein
MIDIIDLVDDILPAAPGCPEPVIEDAIRDVAEQICRDTMGWTFEDDFALNSDQDFLAAPYGAHIIRIDRLTINDEPLEATTERQMDQFRPGWRRAKGVPLHFFQREPDEIRVTPTPDKPYRVSVLLKLAPTHDTTQLPDLFCNRWRLLLKNGAIAHVLALPGKTWSNPELAVYHLGKFNKALETATSEVQRGQQSARIRNRARFI